MALMFNFYSIFIKKDAFETQKMVLTANSSKKYFDFFHIFIFYHFYINLRYLRYSRNKNL